MKVLNKFLKNGTGNYVEGVVNGRTGSGPVRSTSCETPHNTFKIASWNIGTMRGRSSEIVETITRRNVDLCCVQEVRWRGASARHITGKDSRYKFFWVGNNQGTSGVGVLLAETWDGRHAKQLRMDTLDEKQLDMRCSSRFWVWRT